MRDEFIALDYILQTIISSSHSQAGCNQMIISMDSNCAKTTELFIESNFLVLTAVYGIAIVCFF